jgi:aminopeptidase N
VLYMIRTMMFDNRTGDKLFKETMQDFVSTYKGKAATTEDFKAVVEKHISASMDVSGDHKMDWFFNQYVYGTGAAQYSFRGTVDYTADGKTHFKAELTRSGVPDTWMDVVPLYAHIGDKTVKMGNIRASHATESVEATIPGKIDRISINDNEDMLAEVKQ